MGSVFFAELLTAATLIAWAGFAARSGLSPKFGEFGKNQPPGTWAFPWHHPGPWAQSSSALLRKAGRLLKILPSTTPSR